MDVYALLNNLLNWSLSQQKQLNFSTEEFQPEELFSTIVPAYKEFLEQKKLRLNEFYQPNIMLHTSKNCVSIILRNLLDNAIKNAEADSEIILSSSELQNIYTLTVSNVTKLNAEKLSTIQQLFSSNQDWQPGTNGMGIGLVMVQQCVRMMNAKANIEFNQGQYVISIHWKNG